MTLQLVSTARFGAAGQYDSHLVDFYKEHSNKWGSAWDSSKYLWTFNLDQIEVSVSLLPSVSRVTSTTNAVTLVFRLSVLNRQDEPSYLAPSYMPAQP